QAEDPRGVSGDPSETAAPSETHDPSPTPVLAPVMPVPRATPGRTETSGGSAGAKRPPAARNESDEGGTDGDDRSDDRDGPGRTDGGDAGSHGGGPPTPTMSTGP